MSSEIAPKRPMTIGQTFAKHIDHIDTVLPSHIDKERMLRIALTEIRGNRKLSQCSAGSLLSSVMTSASLGLEIGSHLGHAYLVPFAREAQLIIGYRGMIDLARRSGQIVSLTAHAVYKNDEFEFNYGLEEKLVHVPAEGGRGEMTHCYAVARLVGGGHQFKVMTRAALMEAKKRSPGAKQPSSPWNHPIDWIEMCKKTCIRRLFKYLPISVELARAASLNEQVDTGTPQAPYEGVPWDADDFYSATEGDFEETPPASATEGLKKKLKDKKNGGD